MRTLESFVAQSNTFNGFTFIGHYDMPANLFIKLYEIYVVILVLVEYGFWGVTK
jgi:hypothetical protein